MPRSGIGQGSWERIFLYLPSLTAEGSLLVRPEGASVVFAHLERAVWCRSRLAALALAVIAPLALPTVAHASDFAPPDEPHFAFSSGLEPGSVLAGHILPMDWSERVSPCDGDAERSHLDLRTPPSLRPGLCPGDTSDAVIRLQRLLTVKMLYREPITGEYDDATRYAVATFHKLIGPAHTDAATARQEWIDDPPPEDWTEGDWKMLVAFWPEPPKFRQGQPDRIELDIGHQILYLIERDQVAAIIPVSSGAGRGTRGCTRLGCGASVTPRTDRLDGGGKFYYQHNYRGWSPRPAEWSIYKAIFWRGNYGEWNYGLHGYRSVPHYPASHGCTRLTVWDMDFLRPYDASRPGWQPSDGARVEVGMTIHVWDR